MNDRPSMETVLIQTARVMAQRSTCSRAQVGALATIDSRILMSAYNGTPAGMPHCEHVCVCSRSRHEVDCGASGPCADAVHAEANLVARCARYGISLKDATVVTTLTPCFACAQLLINAGVTHVIAAERYRLNTGVELLTRAGVTVDVRDVQV